MAEIQLKGETYKLQGSLLKVGDIAPNFVLVDPTLDNITLDHFKDKKKLLITLPSLDTPTCSKESKTIEAFAKKHPNFIFILVSKDLPFAQQRFCLSEKIENIKVLSFMRSNSNMFHDYGIMIQEGPLAGLCARALFILDESDKVIYAQLVEEITEEPNYEEAFAALEANDS